MIKSTAAVMALAKVPAHLAVVCSGWLAAHIPSFPPHILQPCS